MVAALYQGVSLLWNFLGGPPTVSKPQSASEKALRNLRDELARERRCLLGRAFVWTGLTLATVWASSRSSAIPAKSGIAVGTIGICGVLNGIRQFGQTSLSRASRDIARKGPSGPRARASIPDFPLPPHLEAMCQQELDLLNAGQPIRYFVDGGGRIGITIDAKALPLETLLSRLRIIHHRYPHMARIEIHDAEGDGFEWADDLETFDRLAYLSFFRCPQLTDGALMAVAGACRSLKRIDLRECSALTMESCSKLAQELIVTYPNGTSNLQELLKRCYHEIGAITRRLLFGVIAVRKKEWQGSLSAIEQERYRDLCTLDEVLRSPEPIVDGDKKARQRRIEELMSKLAEWIDPARLMEQDKRQLIDPLVQAAEQISQQPYFSALDSPFHLHLHNLLMCDELFNPLLRAFSAGNVYLISLDLSRSLVEGHCLKHAMGLPIAALDASDLRKFDPSSLVHLIGFHDLRHLNLSRSRIDTQWLLRGVMPLIKLESLRLDGCLGFSDEALAVLGKNHKKLEFLTLVGAAQITRGTVSTLIVRGGEDMTRPFMILWSPANRRRLEISAPGTIDRRALRHLQSIKDDGSVVELGFGAGCDLKEADARELEEFPFLQIEVLDLDDSRFEPSFLKRVIRKWPLRSLKIGRVEIELTHLQDGRVGKAQLRIPERLSSASLGALDSFEAIGELSLSHCPNLVQDRLQKLAAFCTSKGVKRLDLSQTGLSNDDLMLLNGEPKPFMKELLGVCEFIDLQGSQVDAGLFAGWQCDIQGRTCRIRCGNGHQMVFGE